MTKNLNKKLLATAFIAVPIGGNIAVLIAVLHNLSIYVGYVAAGLVFLTLALATFLIVDARWPKGEVSE